MSTKIMKIKLRFQMNYKQSHYDISKYKKNNKICISKILFINKYWLLKKGTLKNSGTF